MAFAPPKKSRKENIAPTQKDLITSNYSKAEEFTDFDLSFTISNQINILETNVKRVKNQQDALMPLVDLQDLFPTLQRADNSIKGFEDRIEDSDQKIASLDFQIKQFIIENNLQDKESKRNVELDSQTKRKLKDIDSLEKKLNDIHMKLTNLPRLQEAKYREEKTNMIRELETQLISSKEQISLSPLEIESLIDEETFKNQSNIGERIVEMKNDIGMLRCEILFLKDKRWEEKFRSEIQKLPPYRNKLQVKIALETADVAMQFSKYPIISGENLEFFQETSIFIIEEAHNLSQHFHKLFTKANTQDLTECERIKMQLCKERLDSLKDQVYGITKKRDYEVAKIKANLDSILADIEIANSQLTLQELEEISPFIAKVENLALSLNSFSQELTNSIEKCSQIVWEI